MVRHRASARCPSRNLRRSHTRYRTLGQTGLKGRRNEVLMDKKWWTLMLLLDVYAASVAQPALQTGLHASFSDVQWTLDAYALPSVRCCAAWPPAPSC
jgi:hypothetical protein